VGTKKPAAPPKMSKEEQLDALDKLESVLVVLETEVTTLDGRATAERNPNMYVHDPLIEDRRRSSSR
jgi:hypothetical protein